jgi:hypothetical protein
LDLGLESDMRDVGIEGVLRLPFRHQGCKSAGGLGKVPTVKEPDWLPSIQAWMVGAWCPLLQSWRQIPYLLQVSYEAQNGRQIWGRDFRKIVIVALKNSWTRGGWRVKRKMKMKILELRERQQRNGLNVRVFFFFFVRCRARPWDFFKTQPAIRSATTCSRGGSSLRQRPN